MERTEHIYIWVVVGLLIVTAIVICVTIFIVMKCTSGKAKEEEKKGEKVVSKADHRKTLTTIQTVDSDTGKPVGNR